MTASVMNIFCIIVTYNGSKWIRRTLDSLSDGEQELPIRVIAVDNGSTDDTLSIIKKEYPDVVVIENGKNLGFGKANNIGIECAYKLGASHFLLLNQDASMAPGSVKKLIEVQLNGGLPLVSPVHWNGSGDRLDSSFCLFVSENPGINDLLSDLLKGTVKDRYKVRFVNAACWLLPKETIEKVGGFDPIYFHYGEDDDFCERLSYHGGSPYIVPDAKMFHDRVGKGNSEMWNKQKLLVALLQMYGVRPVNRMGRIKTHLRLLKNAAMLSLTGKFKDASAIIAAERRFLKKVPMLKSHAEANRRPGPNWLSLNTEEVTPGKS